jgi:hypothetical protein
MTKLAADAFALCASAFAAPIGLVASALVTWGQTPHASLSAVLFWQSILAVEFAAAYLALSLPVAWLLAKLFPIFCCRRKPNPYPMLLAAAALAFFANARFLGFDTVLATDPEIATFVIGLILNVTAFVWLNRRAYANCLANQL